MPGRRAEVHRLFEEVRMQDQVISWELLRRLAEALDGVRTGGTVFLLAAARSPHHVHGAFGSVAEAQAEARKLAEPHDVHGPYESRPAEAIAATGAVERVVATVRMPDGTTADYRISPKEFDSLFWSLSALDKFAIPYYTAMYGVAEAIRLREEFKTARIVPLGPHGKYSRLTFDVGRFNPTP
jgi:hypothetical protein